MTPKLRVAGTPGGRWRGVAGERQWLLDRHGRGTSRRADDRQIRPAGAWVVAVVELPEPIIDRSRSNSFQSFGLWIVRGPLFVGRATVSAWLTQGWVAEPGSLAVI